MTKQYSNRPPFCDFIERYHVEHKKMWNESRHMKEKVALRRFDEWLKVCPYKLEELDWNKLLQFHRFISVQGLSTESCRKSVAISKKVLRWGIETDQLPQKLEDIYTTQIWKHKWDIELPKVSIEYLSAMEATRKGSYHSHLYSHRVFHTFLKERNLTYRRIRIEHMISFIKYLNEKKLQLQTRVMLSCNIKAYFKWLYKQRKVTKRADDLLPSYLIPKRITNLPRPIDPIIDQRVQSILEDTDDQIFKAILLIRRTGMRATECIKLQYDCIEYDLKKRATLRVPGIKLGIERRVPLDNDTVKIIEYLQMICLKHSKKRTIPKNLLINKKGVPYKYEVYSGALIELCIRLDLKKLINLHALRHTYATSLLTAGVSIVSLKEILGHKSISMSLLYAKITPEKVHKEYMLAIKNMNNQQIPVLLKKSEAQLGDCFNDIHSALSKTIDLSSNSLENKKVKRLLNRLAKIKMEVKKLPNIKGMD